VAPSFLYRAMMNTNGPRGRTLLLLIITLALGGAAAGLTQAASQGMSWSPPVQLSSSDGPAQWATLARDPASGDLFVAWEDHGTAERKEILGRRWDRTSETWMEIQNLSGSEWQDGSPTLIFDRQGTGLLLWTRRYAASQGAPADGTDLMWRFWDGEGWSDEQVLMHTDGFMPGNWGLIPTQTPDAILLTITWLSQYRWTRFQDGGWSLLTPWDTLGFTNPDVNPRLTQIQVDGEGLLHAAAFGENSSQNGWDYLYYDAYYLTYNGLDWSRPLNLSSTYGVADTVSMAFDRQGRLHFLWSDPDPIFSSESDISAIYERVYDGGTWTPNAQVTSYNDAQAISEFSLTTDVSDTLHLAWSEGFVFGFGHIDLDIYYQSGDGSAWSPEEQVYTSTADSRYPVLFADSEAASLVWEEGPLHEQDLYFSRKATVPPDLCRGLTDVHITGAITGVVGLPHTFTAWAKPPTATLTITYTWKADEQTPILQTGGHVNLVDWTWETTGTKAITVTAENCDGTVTSTHAISIEAQRYRYAYLPLIIKGDTQ
jgi:hypothetical protein